MQLFCRVEGGRYQRKTSKINTVYLTVHTAQDTLYNINVKSKQCMDQLIVCVFTAYNVTHKSISPKSTYICVRVCVCVCVCVCMWCVCV